MRVRSRPIAFLSTDQMLKPFSRGAGAGSLCRNAATSHTPCVQALYQAVMNLNASKTPTAAGVAIVVQKPRPRSWILAIESKIKSHSKACLMGRLWASRRLGSDAWLLPLVLNTFQGVRWQWRWRWRRRRLCVHIYTRARSNRMRVDSVEGLKALLGIQQLRREAPL